MNKFRYEAMLEEFPFLGELGVKPGCSGIQVKRWDEAVLGIVPNEYSYDGSLMNDWREDDWHAIFPDGTIAQDFVQPYSHYHSNYAHSQDRTETGESVLEAIARLEAEPVFLVRHEIVHDGTSGQEYSHSDWWIVYKAARDVSLASLLAAARQRATREVAAECDF